MNDLTGKIALVTGATSGIGEACAKHFAAAGATVIVAGRNVERGENVVSEITNHGGNAIFKQLDVTQDESIQDCMSFVKAEFGQFDILVNCAGVFKIPTAFEEISRDTISQIMDVNVSGLMMMTAAALPIIRKGGNIINMTSIAGFSYAIGGRAYAYSASKAGVIRFTKQLAKQYATTIRVNAIAPGVIRTPMFVRFDEERYASMIPMGRVGEPEDVAKVATFLASDDSAYMTGVVLTVDGGQTL